MACTQVQNDPNTHEGCILAPNSHDNNCEKQQVVKHQQPTPVDHTAHSRLAAYSTARVGMNTPTSTDNSGEAR
jgi:hypothetical protein